MSTTVEPAATVASNVRRLREARGLSLGALAARSGVGKATLSRLEAGQANPTIETLYALADALRVPLGDVVAPTESGGHLVRAQEGSAVTGDVDARIVDRIYGVGLVEVIDLVFPAGGRREAQPHAPGVVEHLLVTDGHLRAGPVSEVAELGPGDLLRFPGDVPHAYEAMGRRDARAVVLMAYP
jgi:transcriptional regulator with XRE-family HTH domain